MATHRVKITGEMERRGRGNVWFLGEFEGEPVAVEVYDVADVITLRRGLAEQGTAIFDSPAYRVDLATPEQIESVAVIVDQTSIPLSPEEREALLRLRGLVRLGLVRPSEGDAS